MCVATGGGSVQLGRESRTRLSGARASGSPHRRLDDDDAGLSSPAVAAAGRDLAGGAGGGGGVPSLAGAAWRGSDGSPGQRTGQRVRAGLGLRRAAVAVRHARRPTGSGGDRADGRQRAGAGRHGRVRLNTFDTFRNVHTYIHPLNDPLSGTTQVSRYQKGKTNLDFYTGARDGDWQWP